MTTLTVTAKGQVWGSPDFVDSDQGVTEVSVDAATNRYS